MNRSRWTPLRRTLWLEILESRFALAAGDLDLSFSDDGIATVNVTGHIDKGYGGALQNDGKMVIVGVGESDSYFAMSRLLANGALDTSFGPSGTGKIQTRFGTGHQEAHGVAIQPDQRIVVVGKAGAGNGSDGGDFGISRYTANGLLDSSFSGDGLFSLDIAGGEDVAYRVAIQSDGCIVAVGKGTRRTSDFDFTIIRLRPDGELDSEFGDSGVKYVNFPGGASYDIAYDLSIQPNEGKIVVAGSASNQQFLGLARLNANGSLDTTFDQDGIATADFGGNLEGARGIAIDSDGKIIVAGYTNAGKGNGDFALARFNADGSLDTSFGPNGNGKLTTDWFSEKKGDTANSIAIQANGKILVAGKTYSKNGDPFEGAFAVARYESTGHLDPQFGNGGLVRTRIYNIQEEAREVVVQADGSILVAGYAVGGDFAVVRYQGDPTEVGLASSEVTVDESSGDAVITVFRTGGGTGPFSVNFATNQGTATSGLDYQDRLGTLQFNEGELQKTITIPILDDLLREGKETIVLTLSNPTNGVRLGPTSSAILNIIDDDTFSTFTVTNTNDRGLGSLRQAILDSNDGQGRDLVRFNIGTGIQTIRPLSPLPLIADAVVIDGATQPGFTGVPLIELDGSNAGDADGLTISAGNSIVRGLTIRDFQGSGIVLANGTHNILEGNFIGTDFNGSNAHGNHRMGVDIFDSANNYIGGNTATQRNVISGNGIHGITIHGAKAKDNVVAGNYIGISSDGTSSLKNLDDGVYVDSAAQGNIIGTNGDGANDSTEGNVISGNGGDGVHFFGTGTDNNTVAGNIIGLGPNGTTAIPNAFAGVVINRGAKKNLVGSNFDGLSDTNERNIISGNLSAGVWVAEGGTSDNRVSGNMIANNAGPGIAIKGDDAVGNLLQYNEIFSNTGLGIDLGPTGVTPNDPDDSDFGPNNLQNFPELLSAFSSNGRVVVNGSLHSTPNNLYQIEFYSSGQPDPSGWGQGYHFFDEITVSTNSVGVADFSIPFFGNFPLGTWISAIAADSSNNTSEFSMAVEVQGILNIALDANSISENGGSTTAKVTRISPDISKPLLINLTSSDLTEATVPSFVTIPAFQTSANFAVQSSDDTIVDGSQLVRVEAAAKGYLTNFASLYVTDWETLTIHAAQTTLSEQGGITTATLTRNNTDIALPLLVTLATSDLTEATVPTNITIPAEQSSVTFEILAVEDTLLDGTQKLILSASADGYENGTESIDVTDAEALTLFFSPPSIGENGGSTTGTVTRSNSDVSLPLVVEIGHDGLANVLSPLSVTIPAGAKSKSFLAESIDNLNVDGNRRIGFSSTALGYSSGSNEVEIIDDDLPLLTLELDNPSISENSGNSKITVTRNTSTSVDLKLTITCSDPSTATFPSELTIPAGSRVASFIVMAVDTNIAEGERRVTINVMASGFHDNSVNITVTDDEIPALEITLASYSISESGGSTIGKIRRNTRVDHSQVVTLTSSDLSEATVPQSIEILAGESEATFEVKSEKDGFVDGNQVVNILGTAVGFASNSVALTVLDVDVWTWTNVLNPLDCDDDNSVSPLDVLVLINELNRNGSYRLRPPTERPAVFLDADVDGFISPLDVLVVVNYLNGSTRAGEGESDLMFSARWKTVLQPEFVDDVFLNLGQKKLSGSSRKLF